MVHFDLSTDYSSLNCAPMHATIYAQPEIPIHLDILSDLIISIFHSSSYSSFIVN